MSSKAGTPEQERPNKSSEALSRGAVSISAGSSALVNLSAEAAAVEKNDDDPVCDEDLDLTDDELLISVDDDSDDEAFLRRRGWTRSARVQRSPSGT